MFSDHMRKIDSTSGRTLLLVAAILVIVCQLVAMVVVTGGQVKKAELRESNLSFQRSAVARCFEVNTRFDRSSCLQQANADLAKTVPNADVAIASSDQTGDTQESLWVRLQTGAFGAAPQATRGLMPVAFN